jgi:hypothetical protein
MKPIADALRGNGVSPTELSYVLSYPGGLVKLWADCEDPVLMMRIASVLGADPKASVGIAIEGANAVVAYVGAGEPRPQRALSVAKAWLRGRVTAKQCETAAQQAESVGTAYREQKVANKIERRAYRAAAHASFAAAKAAQVARDAAVTTELEYDTDYTFEDAWDGARVSCAIGAAQALLDAVEAALAATSTNTTIETGTAMAGVAAADEARPGALAWAAAIIRSHLSADTLRLADVAMT